MKSETQWILVLLVNEGVFLARLPVLRAFGSFVGTKEQRMSIQSEDGDIQKCSKAHPENVGDEKPCNRPRCLGCFSN